MSMPAGRQDVMLEPAVLTALQILDKFSRGEPRDTLEPLELMAINVVVDAGLHAVKQARARLDDSK